MNITVCVMEIAEKLPIKRFHCNCLKLGCKTNRLTELLATMPCVELTDGFGKKTKKSSIHFQYSADTLSLIRVYKALHLSN